MIQDIATVEMIRNLINGTTPVAKATHATSAESATTAGTANSAGTAETAANANQLGGVAASNYARIDGTYESMTVGKANTATAAEKLSNTSDIGSASKPVYFSSEGKPVECNSALDVSITGNALTATSATSANKVKNSLSVINGDTTVFYDGSAARSVNVTRYRHCIRFIYQPTSASFIGTMYLLINSSNNAEISTMQELFDFLNENLGQDYYSCTGFGYSRRSETFETIGAIRAYRGAIDVETLIVTGTNNYDTQTLDITTDPGVSIKDSVSVE